MIRFIIYLIEIFVIIGVAIILSDTPNAVIVEWQDWRIDTSVGVLLIFIFILALVSVWLLRLYNLILGIPDQLKTWRRERKLVKLQRVNFQIISAIDAGNVEEAITLAKDALNIMENELSRLYLARSYELVGERIQAISEYEKLMNFPNSAFVAAQGIINIKMAINDMENIEELLEYANKIKPNALSIINSRMQLAKAQRDYAKVFKLLEQKKEFRFLTDDEFKTMAADLLYEESLYHHEKQNPERGIECAMRALKLKKGHLQASIAMAQYYIGKNDKHEAQEIIKKAYNIQANNELVQLWFAASPKKLTALSTLSYLEQLVSENPETYFSHKIMMEYAQKAGLNGLVQRYDNALKQLK